MVTISRPPPPRPNHVSLFALASWMLRTWVSAYLHQTSENLGYIFLYVHVPSSLNKVVIIFLLQPYIPFKLISFYYSEFSLGASNHFCNKVEYDHWRRQWHPTPMLLPGKSHGWRSLVGCSPWGRWGSDMTERLPFPFSLSYIGEGNGNPLQCSCLESSMGRGAWWATVHGIAKSGTWLSD